MESRSSARALTLSTVAFVISFAAWGLIAPMARTFQQAFGLTDGQKWMLTAVPVLLGSVLRLPMGMLADRYGGRLVFGLLLLFVTIPAFMLSRAHSYADLLLWAFFLGMAGTSFAVGVAFTTKWFPPQKQGFALGIYGAGNIGQSIALYGAPLLAGLLGGWRATYQVFGIAAFVYGVVFLLAARNAPTAVQPRSLGAMLAVLVREPLCWLFSLFYFVTFGGFVALSISLPNLLQDKTLFGLTREDSGLRVAVLVLVATLMRPLGGWLSDRIGGARVLSWVFAAAGVLALGMASTHIALFTVGALGVAAAIGLGNGAVFKLVPQRFPKDTGTVTGLVGAIGGLGGFFPPLVLGEIKARTASYALGFVLLSVFCWGCLALNHIVLGRRRDADAAGPGTGAGARLDRKAVGAGVSASALLVAAIYAGSRGLRHFDPALIAYCSASILAVFAIVYRYAVWLQRPPTRLYWRRGWQLFLRPRDLPRNVLRLAGLLVNSFVLQTFIERRSYLRWAAHFLISWGCIVACLVTFPLVFGWVSFEADPGNPSDYIAYALGVPTGRFPAYSLVGWLTFHVLDFCAVAIIVGMAFAFRRRMYDQGAITVQQFSLDFMPLVMLFSICITGLMLTASSLWMHGHSYSFLATLHAFCVIVTLVFLPFGKFFHIFQRPANLGVQFYKDEGRRGEQSLCARCGTEYASRMHVEDLKTVLQDLGLDQRMADGGHYQDVCPTCRRKLIGVTQLEAIGGHGFI